MGGPSGDQLAEGQVSKPTPVPPGEKGHRFLPGRRRRCGTVTCLQPLPQEAQQGVSAHTFLSLEVSGGPRDGVPRPWRPLRACSPTPFPATPEASGAFCAVFPVATPRASFRLALRWELSAPLASARRRPPVPCASPSPLVATPGFRGLHIQLTGQRPPDCLPERPRGDVPRLARTRAHQSA